jgi:hypothetical protein
MLGDRWIRPTLVIVITAAVLIVIAFSWSARASRLAWNEARVRQQALARDAVEAAADTSREVRASIAVLGDSLRVAQRRAVQAQQRSDALDRALGLERAAQVRMRAQIDGLSARVRSETVYVSATDGVRRAAFDVRQAPYSVHADVVLPAPPDSGRMDVQVTVDSIALDVRLGCGAAGTAGVRPATVTVVAPRWAAVRLGRVEQAAAVCSGMVRKPANGFPVSIRRLVERVGVTAGFGLTRDASGVVIAGPGVMIGVRAWP